MNLCQAVYFIFAGISIIIIPGTFGHQFQQQQTSLLSNSYTDPQGRFTLNSFINKWWGSEGSGEGQFVRPSQIAVDSSGNVYVADGGNDRIQKFDSSGNFLATWGSYGEGNGQLSYPESIAVDSSGNVYVADGGNDRVQTFSANASSNTNNSAVDNNSQGQQ